MVTIIIIHRPADLIVTPEGGLAVRVQQDHAMVGPGVDTFQQAFLSEYWQANVFVETIDEVLGDGIGNRHDSSCTTQGCVLAEHTALTLTTKAVNQACHDQLVQISTVLCHWPAVWPVDIHQRISWTMVRWLFGSMSHLPVVLSSSLIETAEVIDHGSAPVMPDNDPTIETISLACTLSP